MTPSSFWSARAKSHPPPPICRKPPYYPPPPTDEFDMSAVWMPEQFGQWSLFIWLLVARNIYPPQHPYVLHLETKPQNTYHGPYTGSNNVSWSQKILLASSVPRTIVTAAIAWPDLRRDMTFAVAVPP
jgi:hypothetical protein